MTPKKHALIVVARYTHSGKIDQDNGVKPKRAHTTKNRTIRNVKKKIRRYLDLTDELKGII